MKDIFRSFSWRLGRKLYCWARGDMANDPHSNGEYWLLEQLIDASVDGELLLDVGANIGEWSIRASAIALATNKSVTILAFEPSSATREILLQRLPKSANIEVCAVALSSADGEANFYSSGIGAGTNSLNTISGPDSERVRLTTLDMFLEQRDFRRVSMLKIDTEGYDLDVLHGAARLLADGCIDLVQFEYNWRWLLNNASLLDVFNFISDKPYRFGKLVGNSIEFYENWHFELDRYFENNYFLVRRGSALVRLGKQSQFNSSNVRISSDCAI